MPGLAPTRDPNICTTDEVTQYKTLTRDIVARFEDALQLADSTPRITLSPVIKDMQAIRREAQALELPVCGHNAQNRLIDYMDVSINAFTAFMSQRPESEVNGLVEAVKTRKSQYDAAVDAMTGAATTPTPAK